MTLLRTIALAGPPRQMGQAFGEAFRDDIQIFYQRRVENAVLQAEQHGGRRVSERQVLEVARQCLPATEAHDPSGTAELAGIADGAGLSPEQIVALNGLTDIRDVLAWWDGVAIEEGCSSFVATATAERPLLCGQTWDLATDNMPYVVVVERTPKAGPQTRCLTTVGCLSLIGMNEHGLAVGTTNIRTTDAKPGVTYLSLIHRALASATLDEAVKSIEAADRCGAHYYYLADSNNDAVAIEATSTSYWSQTVRHPYVHCNHCLAAPHQAMEGKTPAASSHARQPRLQMLVSAHGFDVSAAKSALSDHENGDNGICRHDFGGISSNGAVVMVPATGQFVACHGPPCQATWQEFAAL